MCNVTQGDRTYSGQIKGLIDKLTNLKYDMLMAFLNRDIQISRYKQFRHSNESNIHIQFLRNQWFSNGKFLLSCGKLAIASSKGVARIRSETQPHDHVCRGARALLLRSLARAHAGAQSFAEGEEPPL